MFTTIGKSGTALAIGSFASNRPQYTAIGSGSGAVAITNVDLVYEVARKAPTSFDLTTANEVTYTTDWNSVDMSGITLREFGLFTDATDDIGSCWSREGFNGVEFDGTIELQIQQTYQAY